MLAQINSTRPKATPRCRKKSPSPGSTEEPSPAPGPEGPRRLPAARHPPTCPPEALHRARSRAGRRRRAAGVELGPAGRRTCGRAPRRAPPARAAWAALPEPGGPPGSGALSNVPERPERRLPSSPVSRGGAAARKTQGAWGERRVARAPGAHTLPVPEARPRHLRPAQPKPSRERVSPARASALPWWRAALRTLGGSWAWAERG